jgi:hypothetical protein
MDYSPTPAPSTPGETCGLDQDGCCGVVAEGEATAVYHADERSSAADLGNEGPLAKAHLADTLTKSGVTGNGADASRRASRKLT